MQVSDFSFQLPNELIARYPTPDRTASRLMQLSGGTGAIQHGGFKDLLDFLEEGDLLVLNNTKVIPARLFGTKESGGKIEVLVERLTGDRQILAHVRSSKAPKPGARLLLEGQVWATMVARQDALFELLLDEGHEALDVLQRLGHMPLPMTRLIVNVTKLYLVSTMGQSLRLQPGCTLTNPYLMPSQTKVLNLLTLLCTLARVHFSLLR